MAFCAHCPHCTQPQDLPARGGIASVEAEVDRLGSLINALSNDRTTLLRRLNDLRSSTRNLPPHILSSIFEHVVSPVDITSRDPRLYSKETYPDQKEQCIPFLLSSICSQWHYIVQSTPALWTSLIIDVQERSDIAPRLALLRLYLANTKDLSFSLELNFNQERLPIAATAVAEVGHPTDQHDPSSFNLLAQFRDIIFEPTNAQRIKVLRLSSAPSAWSPFKFEDFSRLEELRFGNDTSTPSISRTEILACNPPRLKRLIAKYTEFIMSPTVVDHAWAKSLSSVVLLEVPFGYCLQLLQLLPNLIEFRARSRRLHSSNLPILETELVLPKMEIFEWSFARDESSTSLLRYVHLPSLQTLSLGLIGYDKVEPATLAPFLKRLPPTVTELELVWFSTDPDQAGVDWEVIFPPLANVRKLSLIRCLLASAEEILGCLAYEKRWLPTLEEICIIDWDPAEMEKYDDTPIPKADDDYKIEVRKAVLRIAETRREGLDNGFNVKTIGRKLGWNLRDKKRVGTLISRGLKLEILEDEQLVERLYNV